MVSLKLSNDFSVESLYVSTFSWYGHLLDWLTYRFADKSLARPPSRCILFDGENIAFDAGLVLYIYIYIYIYH